MQKLQLQEAETLLKYVDMCVVAIGADKRG